MGLFGTRWEAQYKGHSIVISRNEWTKGFRVEWDGQEIARRAWSWIGLGELRGTAEVDGTPIEVQVTLDATLKDIGTDGRCYLVVGGEDVPVTLVK